MNYHYTQEYPKRAQISLTWWGSLKSRHVERIQLWIHFRFFTVFLNLYIPFMFAFFQDCSNHVQLWNRCLHNYYFPSWRRQQLCLNVWPTSAAHTAQYPRNSSACPLLYERGIYGKVGSCSAVFKFTDLSDSKINRSY